MTRSFLATVPADIRKSDPAAFTPVVASPDRHPYAADPAQVVDGDYTYGALEAAFSAIQDTTNWKRAIRVAIPAARLDVARRAAAFYGAGRLEVEAVTADRWAVVTAPGYYTATGA